MSAARNEQTAALLPLPLHAGGGWGGGVRRASAELAAIPPLRGAYPSPTLPCTQGREKNVTAQLLP